jgi:hypothetical protein
MASSAWCGIGWLDYLWSASSLMLAKDRQFSIPRQTRRRHGTTGLLGEQNQIRKAFGGASTLQLGLKRGKGEKLLALIRRH